jgi:hypothetical protein
MTNFEIGIEDEDEQNPDGNNDLRCLESHAPKEINGNQDQVE